MPAIAALVLNDGATTPVSHTLDPFGRDDKGVVIWEQITPTPASALGAKRIGYSHKRGPYGKQLTDSSRITFTVTLPVLETLATSDSGITPPPTQAYALSARLEFTIPRRATAQDKKDLKAFAVNLLNRPLVESVIHGDAPLYGV